MEAAQNTFISSTMWTERTGPVVAIATIKKHRAVDAGSHLMMIGNLIQNGWRDLASKNGLDIDVGGIPPLSHFNFQYPNSLAMKAFFVQFMFEKNFLASTLFYAMYAHQTEHVEKYLAAVDEAFAAISELNSTNNLEKSMKGLPAITGFKRLA